MTDRYSFGTFLVETSNRRAHAACVAVCAHPGARYNPLLLTGPSGCGKTHLLKATASRLEEGGEKKVLYTGAEDLADELIAAINRGCPMHRFFEGFTVFDAVLIDNGQFFVGKPAMQDGLLRLMTRLCEENKQFVFAMDRPLSSLPELEEKMRASLPCRQEAEMSFPGRALQKAFLKRECAAAHILLEDPAIELLVDRFSGSLSLLKGCVSQIRFYNEASFGLRLDTAWLKDHILRGGDGR